MKQYSCFPVVSRSRRGWSNAPSSPEGEGARGSPVGVQREEEAQDLRPEEAPGRTGGFGEEWEHGALWRRLGNRDERNTELRGSVSHHGTEG